MSKGRSVVALLIALLASTPAAAHKVQLFAVVSGRQVACRGFFSAGAPAVGCRVSVHLPDGSLLLEGRTDDKGRFVFEATVRADLKIVLDAGEGHTRDFLLKAEKLPVDLPTPGGSKSAAPLASLPAPQSRQAGAPPPEAPASPPPGIALDEQRLRTIVRTALQEELLPLREEMAAARRTGPGITEILGGIGYILGLMGLVAWARSRTRPRGPQARPRGL